MLLRGVQMPSSVLTRSDIEVIRGRANRNGRGYGGAPLDRFNPGNGRREPVHYGANTTRPPWPDRRHNAQGHGQPSHGIPTPHHSWHPPPPGTPGFGIGLPPPPPAYKQGGSRRGGNLEWQR